MDFKDNFGKAEKLFLLKGDNNVLTGFSMGDMTNAESMGYLDKGEIEGMQNKGIESITGDAWKLFMVDMRAFDGINELSLNEETRLTRQDLEGILKNDDISSLADVDIKEEEAKAGIFAFLISQAFSSDPLFLLREYKEGNIIVYPETILFKTLKIIPPSLIESVMEKALGGVEERIKEVQ
jgi:hypothetical protein